MKKRYSDEQIIKAIKEHEAGIESRQLVKKFFTIAMGGDNEVGALHACLKEGISKENFQVCCPSGIIQIMKGLTRRMFRMAQKRNIGGNVRTIIFGKLLQIKEHDPLRPGVHSAMSGGHILKYQLPMKIAY